MPPPRATRSLTAANWCLGADGLSSAYALPLEKMMGDDIAPALQLFAEMLSEDTLIGLVNAVAAPFVSLAENAMATQVDEGVQTIDHTVGQVEMQGYTLHHHRGYAPGIRGKP